MAGTAEKTDPKLWDRVKQEVTGSEKGGRKGQWSARKAQLASAEYKKKGGGYKGSKTADNHLAEWTREEWGTKSGRTSRSSGERYLPRKARAALSDDEYGRSTAAKRRDTARGKQFSRQPADVATKAAGARRSAAPKGRAAAGPPAAARKAAVRQAALRKPGERQADGRKAPARKPAARGTAPRKAAAPAGRTSAPRSAASRGSGARAPAAGKPAAKRPPAAARRSKGGPKR